MRLSVGFHEKGHHILASAHGSESPEEGGRVIRVCPTPNVRHDAFTVSGKTTVECRFVESGFWYKIGDYVHTCFV